MALLNGKTFTVIRFLRKHTVIFFSLMYKNMINLAQSVGQVLEQNDVMRGPAMARLNG